MATSDPIERKTRVLHGDRIGRTGKIRPGSAAAIFNEDRSRILLTRRSDNGQWCLPGGGFDPGESISECCQREVREETGLEVELVRLIGVYSSPDWMLEYPDGNRVQMLSVFFEARIVSGELTLSDETTEFGYFSRAECKTLDLLETHRNRIEDAFDARDLPVVR